MPCSQSGTVEIQMVSHLSEECPNHWDIGHAHAPQLLWGEKCLAGDRTPGGLSPTGTTGSGHLVGKSHFGATRALTFTMALNSLLVSAWDQSLGLCRC